MFFRKLGCSLLLSLVFLISVLISAFFGSIGAQNADASTIFNRTLSVGSTGQDVKFLQQVLNNDLQTKVAINGAGSPGFETTFYGNLTMQAVIKFQKARGLYINGIVDQGTRIALNNYVDQNNLFGGGTNQNISSTQSSASPVPPTQDQLNNTYHAAIGVIPGTPYIDSISPKSVTNGDMITIYGRYFSTTTPNTVYMSYNNLSVVSSDGNTLRVPVKSYLNDLFNQKMKNSSSEERKKAISKTEPIPLFIVVQNQKGESNPYMIYLKFK